MVKLYLHPKKEESVLRFHPWIFSGAISHSDGNPEEGDLVEVYDSQKRFLAIGHCQVGSIAVRILTFKKESVFSSGFINSSSEIIQPAEMDGKLP